MTAELQPGRMLEGSYYQIVRFVGSGGMGGVYEVEHVRLKKRYIAKTLHADMRGRQDLLKRMEREAQALARIAHPNIVQVHHLDITTDGIPYFIMDKLVGVDLRRLIRSGKPIELEVALGLIIDVLEALGHAHAEGIIHRDIKPENIFLAQSGPETVTKLLDFGIAHVRDDDRLTGNRFIGTWQYASPEQVKGLPVLEQSDIYSTACVLYELIAKRGPFDDMRDPIAIGNARCQMPAPRLSRYANVPIELEAAIAGALAMEPNKRPATATAFAAQLFRIKQRIKRGTIAEVTATREELPAAVQKISAPASTRRVDDKTAEGMPAPTLADETLMDAPGALSATAELPASQVPMATAPQALSQTAPMMSKPASTPRMPGAPEPPPHVATRMGLGEEEDPLAALRRAPTRTSDLPAYFATEALEDPPNPNAAERPARTTNAPASHTVGEPTRPGLGGTAKAAIAGVFAGLVIVGGFTVYQIKKSPASATSSPPQAVTSFSSSASATATATAPPTPTPTPTSTPTSTSTSTPTTISTPTPTTISTPTATRTSTPTATVTSRPSAKPHPQNPPVLPSSGL
jgi:serine/threonine-protein kinase